MKFWKEIKIYIWIILFSRLSFQLITKNDITSINIKEKWFSKLYINYVCMNYVIIRSWTDRIGSPLYFAVRSLTHMQAKRPAGQHRWWCQRAYYRTHGHWSIKAAWIQIEERADTSPNLPSPSPARHAPAYVLTTARRHACIWCQHDRPMYMDTGRTPGRWIGSRCMSTRCSNLSYKQAGTERETGLARC